MRAGRLDITAIQAILAAAAAWLAFTAVSYVFRRRLAPWCALIAALFALAGAIAYWRN